MSHDVLPVRVSVIITTKNEEKNIGACAESVKNQAYPYEKIEIIVVDNGSTDRTKEIALRYTSLVYNAGPERSAQRNFGAEKAQGEFLLFLDADMILSRNVIAEAVDFCEKEGGAAVYIPEKVVGEGFWIAVRNFERSFYDATVIDCVRFVKKTAFNTAGGFDISLTGPEDWDFDRKIRAKVATGIISAPLFHNEGVFNLSTYLRKKAYYAGNFEKYIGKWGKRDKIIRKQFGIWYRYFGVFCEKGRWLRLVCHPVLTSGMYFLRILVGIEYLKKNSGFRVPGFPDYSGN